MQQRPQEEKRVGLIRMESVEGMTSEQNVILPWKMGEGMASKKKSIGVGDVAVSSGENVVLTQKMAKYWDPTPTNYDKQVTVDISRSPDDPLFYCSDATTKEVTRLLDPVTRGHVATLSRIMQEIALEDLKINKSDLITNQRESDPSLGRVELRIVVEKSVLRICYIQLVPPGFLNLIRVVIHYDSTDKIYIDNRIEDSGICNEKASELLKRCTFPRNQAVAILYLAMHQPAAKFAWTWYKFSVVQNHKAMADKIPKCLEMVLDPDTMTQGLEIRAMRQSKDEDHAVKKIVEQAHEPVGKYYDEALRLAHIILSEPRVPPLIGALYGMYKIMLDFGYAYVTIQPFAPCDRFRVGMGKHDKCGEVITDDVKRVQEVLLDTTKLTIREMRLKYDQVYQRQCLKTKMS